MQFNRGVLRALAGLCEQEIHGGSELGRPGPPVVEAPVAGPPYAPDESGYRYFSIPGNNNDRWDDEVHGVELSQEQIGSGNTAEVAWKPGEYAFSMACCSELEVRVTEHPDRQKSADPKVLRGIHLLLTQVMPNEV